MPNSKLIKKLEKLQVEKNQKEKLLMLNDL
jgi:hypothetical protein